MAITHKFFKLPSQSSFERVPASGHTCIVSQFPAPATEGKLTVATTPLPAPKKRQRGVTSDEDQRKSLLAKVHVAKKELMAFPGFDDDAYRGILNKLFKVDSAAKLTCRKLLALLAYFSSLGWQVKKGRHRKDAPAVLSGDPTIMSRQARMEKIEAMLSEKGRVEGTDMPWGYAVAILKRQTGGEIKTFNNATPEHLDAVIAALYRDAKRKGRRAR